MFQPRVYARLERASMSQRLRRGWIPAFAGTTPRRAQSLVSLASTTPVLAPMAVKPGHGAGLSLSGQKKTHRHIGSMKNRFRPFDRQTCLGQGFSIFGDIG